jgi:hypothetical protein
MRRWLHRRSPRLSGYRIIPSHPSFWGDFDEAAKKLAQADHMVARTLWGATVFVYVNTAMQVGEVEHIKIFSTEDAAKAWLDENDPRAWRSSTWS